jgi:phenylpropionate dioxygenase-like ring-hydroxylating dioxygenase large terminal subunit
VHGKGKLGIFYDNPALRDFWYAAAAETELALRPVARTVLGQRIVIYLDPGGKVVAAPDRCPHREAPLSLGTVSDGVLKCAYHGWGFGDGGRCVSIPSADPQFPIPRSADLPCIRAVVKYGLVWVSPGENPAELPRISQEDDPAFRRINNPVDVWRVSATRMTDNFLDIAHFPWVHSGTFGNRQRTRVEDIELELLDDGYYGYRYEVMARNPPGARLISGQSGGDVNRRMDTGFHLPFAVRSTIRYETGTRHIILLLTTPIDDVNSYFTFVVWRNDDFSVSAEDVIAFDRMIGAEDKHMLEHIPGVLPLTPQGVVATQSDKSSTAWRFQFARLLGINPQASRLVSEA